MEKIGVTSVKCVDIISFDDDVLEHLPKPQFAMLLCLPSYKKVVIPSSTLWIMRIINAMVI